MNIDLHGFGPAMMAGTLMTVKLALCALLLGLVLGLLGALAVSYTHLTLPTTPYV